MLRLEYIQVLLKSSEDIRLAKELRNSSKLRQGVSYLCYDTTCRDYLYSTIHNETFDVLVNNFEEFNQALLLINLGLTINDIKEKLLD